MTPTEIDALTTPTTAQQLKLVRWKIMQIEAGAASLSVHERSITNHDLKTLYARERELVQAIEDESTDGSDGGFALVQYGERQ